MMKPKESDRVRHKDYGDGTIIKLDSIIRGEKRWIVKFDNPPFSFEPAIWHDELTKIRKDDS